MQSVLKRVSLLAALLAFVFAGLPSQSAEARVFVGYGYGYGYGYPAYYHPWGWGPYPYYSAYYYGPPAYAYDYPYPPPAYVAPVATPVEPIPAPPLAANQTSPTFIDHFGRTCRHFDSTASDGGPITGKACLQPDGTWRAVN